MNRLVETIRLAKTIKAAGPRKFTRHMVPHVVRPAQIIWNKALGAVFLMFSVGFFAYAWKYSSNPAGLGLSAFMGIVMGYFGATSWLKARRLARP